MLTVLLFLAMSNAKGDITIPFWVLFFIATFDGYIIINAVRIAKAVLL